MNLNFKEWILDEIRNKGLYRQFRNDHPNMPDYVAKDIYNALRIRHMGTKAEEPGFDMKSLSSRSSDQSQSHGSSPRNMINNMKLKNISWTQSAEGLKSRNGLGGQEGVTPMDFDDITQRRFLHRRFGMTEMESVPNDAMRTAKQKEIMTQRGDGGNEPVIVLHTPEGYRLMEGWHRTMNMLISGAPQEALQILQDENQNMNSIDFNSWNPVKIVAFIGRDPEMQKYMGINGTGSYEAGTGSFDPYQGTAAMDPTGNSDPYQGTAAWTPEQ